MLNPNRATGRPLILCSRSLKITFVHIIPFIIKQEIGKELMYIDYLV